MAEPRISGERLKEFRFDAGLSQRELAKRAGVVLTTAQFIEQGKVKQPHFSTVKKLADALGVDPRDLLEGEVRPKDRRPRPSKLKTQVELLEDRLSQYQERGEESEKRWLDLHGAALFMLDRTKNSALRKRYKTVAREAYDGWLKLLGVDTETADAKQVVAEILGEDREQVEVA